MFFETLLVYEKYTREVRRNAREVGRSPTPLRALRAYGDQMAASPRKEAETNIRDRRATVPAWGERRIGSHRTETLAARGCGRASRTAQLRTVFRACPMAPCSCRGTAHRRRRCAHGADRGTRMRHLPHPGTTGRCRPRGDHAAVHSRWERIMAGMAGGLCGASSRRTAAYHSIGMRWTPRTVLCCLAPPVAHPVLHLPPHRQNTGTTIAE